MSLSLGRKVNWLWVFPAIGSLLLAVGLVIQAYRIDFERSALRATGEVVALERQSQTDSDGNQSTVYCAIVRFADGGGNETEFQNRTCSSPASYEVGDRVEVLYPQDAPRRARLDGFADRWLPTLVVGGIGAMFLLIGLALVLPRLIVRRRGAILRVSGRAIMATVVGVEKDGGLRINGRSPWRIHAQWQASTGGKVYMFDSESLWFDPTPFLAPEIRVMIEPERPSRYWVDTSSLPELA